MCDTYHWFFKLKDSDPLWTPLSQKDSDRLEFEKNETIKIPVKGGRYDVDLKLKSLIPVYWKDTYGLVYRFKWSKTKKELLDEENNMILKTFNQTLDTDEMDKFDHVCFIVHGIGEGCDLQLRSILECANSFRKISNEIINANLEMNKTNDKLKEFNSIEFLPITWHDVIHSDKERWKDITLPTIPRLRLFSNTAISDMIFYTNKKYRRLIMERVITDLNKYVKIFKERNPYYNGKISLIGHSLGSLIVFDLLSFRPEDHEKYKFDFKVDNFFAIGSSIPFFLTTRGINLIDREFKLNCDFFYNIFHQLDPFAYRMEPLIKNTEIAEPVLVSKCSLDTPLWNMLSFSRSENCIHKVSNNEYLSQEEGAFNYQNICAGNSKNLKIKRVDYALEKSVLENLDYLLFLTAHSSYWDSYDLIVFILKQLYYQDEIDLENNNKL